jgi:hypothetical protein
MRSLLILIIACLLSSFTLKSYQNNNSRTARMFGDENVKKAPHKFVRQNKYRNLI